MSKNDKAQFIIEHTCLGQEHGICSKCSLYYEEKHLCTQASSLGSFTVGDKVLSMLQEEEK